MRKRAVYEAEKAWGVETRGRVYPRGVRGSIDGRRLASRNPPSGTTFGRGFSCGGGRVSRSKNGQMRWLLNVATRFLDEVRDDMAEAARCQCDLPPRLRSVHEQQGHATPEYRTVGIPVPPEMGTVSPEVLGCAVSHFAAAKHPDALVLAFAAVMEGADGASTPVLILEARDHGDTRMYRICPYRSADGVLCWSDDDGGWLDPKGEEMIIDAAFAVGAGV